MQIETTMPCVCHSAKRSVVNGSVGERSVTGPSSSHLLLAPACTEAILSAHLDLESGPTIVCYLKEEAF